MTRYTNLITLTRHGLITARPCLQSSEDTHESPDTENLTDE
jgi:hypothetical protein